MSTIPAAVYSTRNTKRGRSRPVTGVLRWPPGRTLQIVGGWHLTWVASRRDTVWYVWFQPSGEYWTFAHRRDASRVFGKATGVPASCARRGGKRRLLAVLP